MRQGHQMSNQPTKEKKMKTQQHTVTELRMPICSHGFRSGYATATVDGVRKKLHTSRSDRTDYSEHERDVRDQFANGDGDVV